MLVELDDFEFGCGLEPEYYREGARDLIRKLLPVDIIHSMGDLVSRVRFNDLLPLIKISELTNAPCNFSVSLLCKYRQNVSHFFYEMISRWLLPQKRLNVDLFFSSDVRLPRLSDDLLSVAEIVVQIKSTQDLEEIRRNFKQIETELRLGLVSDYQARRILEFKGLSNDGKTAMIQERISSLIQNRSKDFDCGIVSRMQHFLVTCCDEFKSQRDYHHISRMISNLYSLGNLLKQNIEVLPNQRHIVLKLLKTRLTNRKSKEGRSVLGILAGLNFLREREIFEKGHLIGAISQIISDVRFVEGSFFVDRSQGSLIQMNYLEIEKAGGLDFTHEEIQMLRTRLPDLLKAHVEQLAHPIFMPRNEEEVLRNIMALSRQLRFVTDIPQMIISFDEQRGSEMSFTVILLRVLGADGKPLAQLFEKTGSGLKIIFDRVRSLGALGRKHIKEASVFRVFVECGAFLRPDHSLDLYQARRYILDEVSRVLGEVRDYNGGMIGKQNEVLAALKRSLGRSGREHAILLERFFFALTPVELRSVMNPEHLKQLFLLLIQAQKKYRSFHKKNADWLFRQEEKRLYIVLPGTNSSAREKVHNAIDELHLPPYQLISCSIDIQEIEYTGFVLQCDDLVDQKRFYDAIERSLELIFQTT